MARRIFIAIEIPKKIRPKLAEHIGRWRWLSVHWLPPENWHVTLIPPVLLEEDEIPAMVDALAAADLGAPFPVVFEKVRFAPLADGRGQARMIWLEGEAPKPLIILRRTVASLLKSALAIPPSPGRDFHLHVTLARFEPGALRELERRAPILGETTFRFTASSISVMESRLKQTGAEYERVGEIFLR